MGYVKSKTIVLTHCDNCNERITKCNNCKKNLHWKVQYILCEDNNNHFCSTKCYDEWKEVKH